MTYSPIIPQGLPPPRDQVVQVQTNFAQFAAIFSLLSGGVTYNHTALNDPHQGDHESILLTLQNDDPEVIQDLVAFYCKNAPSQAGIQPQLFFRTPKFLPTKSDPTTAGNAPMQLTYNSVNTAGPVFQSFLAGAYILYFGMITDITVNITLSPAPTKILAAIANANTLTSVGTPTPFDVSTQILSNSTFKINSNLDGTHTTTYSFTWLAVAQA